MCHTRMDKGRACIGLHKDLELLDSMALDLIRQVKANLLASRYEHAPYACAYLERTHGQGMSLHRRSMDKVRACTAYAWTDEQPAWLLAARYRLGRMAG